MKDLLNFKITAAQAEDGAIIRIFHAKKPGIAVSFKIGRAIKAEHVPTLIKGSLRAWANEYTRKTRKPLTKSQKTIYEFILQFHIDECRAPTYDEIKDGLNYASRGSVHTLVQNIIDRGWLWRDEDNKIVPCDLAAPEVSD